MSVALSTKSLTPKTRPDVRLLISWWHGDLQAGQYATMHLIREQSIREVLNAHVGKIKWYLLGQASQHGNLNIKWPSVNIGSLKGVHVDVTYDVVARHYQCQLTYRDPDIGNQWAARFTITEQEITSAHGM